MKRALAILTFALGANCALIASGAFAQGTAAPATPASAAAGTSGTERDARVEQRIATLHSQLKITPGEETQWNAFADVMRENGKMMSAKYRARAQTASTQSALDNMKQYADLMQAHADGMKTLVAAFEPLYNSFSPAQKQLADAAFRDHMGEHHHRKHGAKPANPAQQ